VNSTAPVLKQLPQALSAAGRAWLTQATDPYHDTEVKLADIPDDETGNVAMLKFNKSLQISAPAETAGNWSAVVWVGANLYTNRLQVMNHVTGYANTLRLSSGSTPGGGVDTFGDNPVVAASAYQTFVPSAEAETAGELPVSFVNVHKWNTDVLGDANARVFPDASGGYVAPTSVDVFDALPPGTSTSSTTEIGSRMRVSGCGLELINTTADLYKQGSVTVTKYPRRYRHEAGWIFDCDLAPEHNGPVVTSTPADHIDFQWPSAIPIVRSDLPPPDLQQAMLLPQSRQWAAAEGAYVVPTLHVKESRLDAGRRVYHALTGTMATTAVTSDSGNLDAVPAAAFTTPATGYVAGGADYAGSWSYTKEPQIFQEFHSDGCVIYLAGLSPQTTFRLDLRISLTIEAAPNDPTFGILALHSTPSSPYDMHALTSYAMIMSRLPAGVPSSENPSGEFWDKVVSVARTIAPYLTYASVLLPGAAGAVVGAVGRIITAVTGEARANGNGNGAAPAAQSKAAATAQAAQKKAKKKKIKA
jgi:hypothetical protein